MLDKLKIMFTGSSFFQNQAESIQSLKDQFEKKPKKRKPFQTKVYTPWYSVNRTRNMLIYAALGCAAYYSIGINNQIRSIKYGIRMSIEKFKFKRELDREDRLFEQRLQEGTASK